MTDTEYEAEKARVERYCEKWRAAVGLGWWTVTYAWLREPDLTNIRKDAYRAAAVTHTTWVYRQATIDWHLDVLQSQNDEELEHIVVHEFAHVLIDGLRQCVPKNAHSEDLMEYITEGVARALMYAREFDKPLPVEGEY